MAERELPPPSTTVEMYLAAILDEMRALNRRPQSLPDGTVELKEPKRDDGTGTNRSPRNNARAPARR